MRINIIKSWRLLNYSLQSARLMETLSPTASDWQSEVSELAVRPRRTNLSLKPFVDWMKSATFANKSHTMLEDRILEDEMFVDEPKQVWIVAEAPSRDIAGQLADLHTLKGAGFISMLKAITQQRAFTPLEGESNIFLINGMHGDDYDNLMNAARKAVEHGYRAK